MKKFAKDYFPDAKSDLFACFIERSCTFCKDAGHYGAMITMQSWMFLASFEKMRSACFANRHLVAHGQLGSTCAFA